MSTLGGLDFPLVCGLSEAVRVEDEVEEDPEADEDDAALWRYIPSAFLRIHRYSDRSRHIVDVPVVRVVLVHRTLTCY